VESIDLHFLVHLTFQRVQKEFLLYMLEGIIYTFKGTRTAVVVKYVQEHQTVVTKLLLYECMRKCVKCKFQRTSKPSPKMGAPSIHSVLYIN